MSNDSDNSETPKRDTRKKRKDKNRTDTKKRASSARKNRRAKLEQQGRKVLDRTSSTTITSVLSDLGDGIFLDSPTNENDLEGDNISSLAEIKLAPPPIKTISSRQYVEQKTNRKFSTYDIEDAFYEEDEKLRKGSDKPVKAAVAVQKFFRPLARLCCGLLGGMSLWQCLIMWQWRTPFLHSFMEFLPESIQYLQSLFYLLGTISLISTLDSFDFGELNRVYFQCCYPCRKAPLLIGVVLVTAVFISLLGAPLDEHLAFSLYNNRTANSSSETTMNTWDVEWWETMNAARCVGGVLAWILFSLLLGSDTLQIHLIGLIGLTKQREEVAKETEKEDNTVK